MLVSVCIPTYNGERFIVETLNSVLSQSHPHLDVVISDHGSSDSTLELVNAIGDERVRVVHMPRGRSIAENWNNAVAAGVASFVKVMGQDDVLYPDAIRSELSAISACESEVAFCFSDRDVIDPNGRTVFRPGRPFGNPKKLRSTDLLRSVVSSGANPIGEPVAVMFRKEAWHSIGGFRGEYVIDLDFYARLLMQYQGFWTGIRVGAFRVHADSWGSNLMARQFKIITLFGRLHHEQPSTIRRRDLVIGALRAVVRTPVRVIAQQVVGRR